MPVSRAMETRSSRPGWYGDSPCIRCIRSWTTTDLTDTARCRSGWKPTPPLHPVLFLLVELVRHPAPDFGPKPSSAFLRDKKALYVCVGHDGHDTVRRQASDRPELVRDRLGWAGTGMESTLGTLFVFCDMKSGIGPLPPFWVQSKINETETVAGPRKSNTRV